jgi:hypothetical protein
LFVQWPALSSRAAWATRAERFGLPTVSTWLGALVVLGLLGHALLGLWRYRDGHRAAQASSTSPDAEQRFQLVTGLGLLAFVGLHLLQLWPREHGPHASALDAHQVLWSSLGRAPVLVSYVVGVTALAFHLGVGLARIAKRHVPSWRAARYLAFALGVWLWLGYLQVLGGFAIGEALVPL